MPDRWTWFSLDKARHVLELTPEIFPDGCAIELAILLDDEGVYAEWWWSEDGRLLLRPTVGKA